jgi:hypothetical protein
MGTIVKRVFGVLLLALLAACGSGGGGGGGGGGPGPVIANAADYWSASQAAFWSYDSKDNALNRVYRNRVTMGAPLALGGRTLQRFDYTLPFDDPTAAGAQYRSLDPEGIHAYLEATPTSLAFSYVELPAQIRQETYRAFEMTEQIPGGSQTLRIDVTVAGFENLVLPAGRFDNALKAVQRFTVTVTINNQTATAFSDLTLWYARGIGVVRQTLDDPSQIPRVGTYVEQLAGLRLPTVRAGVIGEFVLLDALTPAISSVTTGQPGVASDGTGHLVAARSMDPATFATRIVAAYVDADGVVVWSKTVIDNLGVASAPGDYPDPVAVAFDGTDFWIVARTSTLNSTTLVRQRVSPAGTLRDGTDGATIGDGTWPRLASNGTSVLLVLARNLGGPAFDWAMFATLFAPGGTVLRAEQQIALPGNGNSGFAAVTANGGQYLVSYEIGDPRDVNALRIDATGTVLDATSIVVSAAANTQGSSAVAPWGGTDFVTLWIDGRNYGAGTGQFDIFGARVAATGTLLDGPAASGGVALNRRASERFGTAGAAGAKGTLLAWTAGSFAGTTSVPSGVFARRFAPGAAFVVADPTTDGILVGLLGAQDVAVRTMAPAVSASPDGYLVAWIHNTESSGTSKSVRGALVYPPVGGP